MNNFKNHILKDSLHHAYLIEGDIESTKDALVLYLQDELGIQTESNADFVVEMYSTFTIDNGRVLKSRQGERAADGGHKFFIIQTDFFNIEAQHALLKVFEEPSPHVHFFILTPQAGNILDTLASRVSIIHSEKEERGSVAGKKFIEQSKPERLKSVAKLIKDHEDDDDSGSLRREAITLLNSLESFLHEHSEFASLSVHHKKVFEEIARARSSLSIPGASVKMLLESIALLV